MGPPNLFLVQDNCLRCFPANDSADRNYTMIIILILFILV
jgi:hypothetical protein